MGVRSYHPWQDRHAGRVDDVLVVPDAVTDFGDLAGADEHVGFPLAVGRHDRSPSDQHRLAHAAHGTRALPLNSAFSRPTSSASSALALVADSRDASFLRRAQ